MATITLGGSGNWSSTTPNAPWPGGTLPTGGSTGDDVVIPKNLTLTLDTASAVAKSITLNVGTTGADVGGKLTVNSAVDTKLVVYNGITESGSNSGATAGAFSGIVDIDMSSATNKCEIYTNGAAATNATGSVILNGKINLKGRTKTRWTLTTGALTANSTTSIGVSNATGWQVGDKLIFATTQAYNATPRTDLVTIATLAYDSGSSGPATVTWTDGTGTGGAVAYSHDTACLVGNFHSNLIFGPSAANSAWAMRVECFSRNAAGVIQDVEFRSPGATGTFGYAGAVSFYDAINGISFDRNVFYDFGGTAVYHYAQNGDVPKSDNVYFTTRTGTAINNFTTQTGSSGNETNMAVFRCVTGVSPLSPGYRLINPMISGCTSRAIFVGGYGDARIEGGGIWSCNAVNYHSSGTNGTVNFDQTWLGKGFPGATYASANNAYISTIAGPATTIYTSCPENLSGGSRIDATGGSATSEVAFFNKNNDAAQQEIYRTKYSASAPVFVRDSAVASNANASMRVDTLGAAVTFSKDFPVLAKAGEALTLFVYARKNAAFNDGTNTRPTATISGLGITPVTATMTDVDDTWEKLDLSYAAGAAPSADGQLTLTLSCQSSTATAKAYFSGLPIVPFVTRCRHYGYLFDETSPTRTADSTISAAFATADAYTGITITWGATSTIALGASQTFQKLIDYTAAKAIANVGSALPITWAGVADNAALFAQGNITTTGYTLNGGGSLAMGGKTLTASVPWSYTYTGGTFSQAASVPAFSGGTLNIGAAGTYTYTQSAAMILSMTPTAPGTYALGDTTFTGQVDLRNTSGTHAITVELPSGTSYTTANNTGATITVTVPIVTADISITGMVDTTGANNRLQIINQSAITALDWQPTHVYSIGDLVLRTSGIGNENTAGLYMRCTSGGTSSGSEPTWNTTVGNTTTDGTVTWTTYSVLYYDADPASTSFTDTYIDGEEFLAGETIEIRFAEEDPGVSFKTYSTSVVATADGFSALVNEESDDVYAIYALSGAAYETTFSPNYVANYIVLDANTDFSGKAAYAYYCYLLTTSQGMYLFWGGLTGIDAGNIRNNVDTISLYFDESGGFVKQTDDVRIFRSDSTRPAIDPTTGGSGIEINWRTPVSVVSTGGSALTSEEHNALLALPTATDVWNNSKALTVPKFLGLK